MRQLTLKGYLEKYLIDLSGLNTASVSKLIKEIPNNPRLLEPLAVYSVLCNTSDNIIKKNDLLYNECIKVRKSSDIQLLSNNYQKLYNSYNYFCSKKTNEDDTKKKMHSLILKLQKEKNISTQQIYKELHFDKSNTLKFISDCNCNRLSLSNVRSILNYVKMQ